MDLLINMIYFGVGIIIGVVWGFALWTVVYAIFHKRKDCPVCLTDVNKSYLWDDYNLKT